MAGKIIDATLRFIDKFTKPMDAAIGKMEKSSRQMQRMGKDIEKAGKKITDVGSSMTKGITVPVAAAGVASIKAGIDFESAFAGVKKTVDATDEQLKTLKTGILDMSQEIPAAATEISSIAEAAGQLGIETDNVIGFTRTMVDLGNSTNLTANEAAESLAKYANVTGMSQKDFGKLGSTIVALGNNFATTESDIVAMATRLSGAGAQIGLTDGEIMGFSTALSSVGIEAEMGGSAFSKAMINMQMACETGFDSVNKLSKQTGMSLRELELMSENDSKSFKEMAQGLGYTNTEMKKIIKAGNNLESFADVAGMSAEKFKQAYEKDAAGALQSFIKGLGDTEGKGESTIKMLQDMGFTEVRLRDTLTRLSQSGEGMAAAVEMGNSAWDENNALTNEAAQRYETTESKIQIIKNKFTALGIQIADILMPKLQEVIDKISSGIDWFTSLDDKTKKTIVNIAGAVALLGPAFMVAGKLTQGVGGAVKGIGVLGKTVSKSAKAFDGLKKVGTAGTAFAKFGKIGKAAFMGLTSPAGIAVIAIMAIAVIAILLIKNWKEVKRFLKGLGTSVKNTFEKCGLDTKKFKTSFDNVKKGISSTVSNLKVIFGKIREYLKPVIIFIATTFIKKWQFVFELAKGILSAVAKYVGDQISAITNIFRGITDFLAGAFTGNWKKAFNGLKTFFKGWGQSIVGAVKLPINGIIGLVNGAINGINKLHIEIPDWVPGVGGKEFGINIPTIPMLYKGTSNWQGGPAMIHDKGAEVVDLPRGTRVYPHDKSIQMAYQDGAKTSQGNATIIIKKLADKIEVRSDSDIDRIAEKMAYELERVIKNGGAVPA